MAEWRSGEVSVVIADAMQKFYEVMPWVRRRSYTVVLPSIRRNNLRTGELYCPDPLSSFWDTQEAHGRVAERKQLQLKAIQRPMLKSPPSSSVGETTIKSPMAEWRSGSSFN
ncbi:unnamed protein product [Staurois parvus]|uniref:Uncharacterized protein n=1 Tax=Staurois parvus TaxID=386267 RepID=A0ABN9BD17_9NEOB|nr:unnamed protein product [Staurois parvus]